MVENPQDLSSRTEGAPGGAPRGDIAASPGPQATPGKPKRPGAPFGIGLTLIICGSLAALFGVFGGLFTMTTSSMLSGMMTAGIRADPAVKQAFDAVMADSKWIYVVQGVMQTIMGLISVLALVAGIGLMKYRLWGRKLALVWAGFALAYIVISLFINFIYIMPASEKLVQAMLALTGGSANPFSGMMTNLGGVSQIFGSLLLAVLPVLTLVLISKDKIRKCLS
jgi:hypothetical protein